MGTGSSKRRNSETVVVNAGVNASLESKESERRKKQENLMEARTVNSNMEIKDHIGNETNTTVKISDETSRNDNTSAENNNDIKEDSDIKEETAKLETLPQEVSVLLSSFCEKYPDIKVLLTSTAVSFQGLKEALDSGNMASTDNINLAKRLIDSYLKCKKRSNRVGLTDFALTLGIPKFVCDIVKHVRTQYPELTTWDRGKQNAEQKESEATPDSDHEESVEEDKAEDDKVTRLKIVQDVVNNLGSAILNFTDLHDPFCLACSELGMVSLFVEMIKDLKDAVAHNAKFENPETQRLTKYTARGRMLSRLLGALHNLSKRVQVRSMFLACEAVDVLIPLLKAEVTLFATKALLVLAYLIDEQNNHVIMADEGPIKFLTNALDKSLKFSHHRYLGFSAAELAEGLTQIAVNDSNKKTIAQCGAIPILAKMLITAKENQERINGCSTLWTLAFDADNREEIKSNEHAVTELRKLASHENIEVKQAAAGALWEVEGKHKHSEESYHLDGAEEVTDTKHIMISYQWDVQSSMIQLKNRLQADGYKVWMDVDQMGGSTLESMAKAVEDATVVLIGVSQKYKESPNCRSEAEYTFQLHKDIIPLMMEKRYRPDGWLGMVVGTKFWIDCSDKHKLDSSIDRLKKELGSRGNLTTQDTVKVVTADIVDAAPGLSINSWTHDDARDWLIDLGLHGRMDSTAVKKLNGAMLIRLQDLRKESPEFFFSSIGKEFGLTSLFDVLEFTDALDKLVG